MKTNFNYIINEEKFCMQFCFVNCIIIIVKKKIIYKPSVQTVIFLTRNGTQTGVQQEIKKSLETLSQFLHIKSSKLQDRQLIGGLTFIEGSRRIKMYTAAGTQTGTKRQGMSLERYRSVMP